jgi:hypothetical protein
LREATAYPLARAEYKPACGRDEQAEEGNPATHNEGSLPRLGISKDRYEKAYQDDQQTCDAYRDSEGPFHRLLGSSNGFGEQLLEHAPAGVTAG